MEHRTVFLNEFRFIGIELSTNIERAEEEIAAHWEKFIALNLQDSIPNSVDSEILGLYTDYRGAIKENFSFIIGCRVENFDMVPEGMVAKTIPAATYAVFTAKGKFPDALLETWQFVLEDEELERNFLADFEVYGEKFNDPEHPEMELWIGIREETIF